MKKKHEERKPDDDELARARELLARTVRFLSQCSQDPEAALRNEDPKDLIRGLESLSVEPEDLPESRPIQIRRRKSA